MKKYLLFILCLSFCSCAKYLPYKSQADRAHTAISVTTEMSLILRDDSFGSYRDLLVFAAVDKKLSGDLYYILCVPSEFKDNFDNAYWQDAVSILPNDANALIKGLDNIILHWNLPSEDTTGYFYTFKTQTNSPTQTSYLASPTTIIEYESMPTLEFTYNRTSEGSYSTLFLGRSTSSVRYELDDIEHVKFFRSQLIAAIENLHKRGMP